MQGRQRRTRKLLVKQGEKAAEDRAKQRALAPPLTNAESREKFKAFWEKRDRMFDEAGLPRER